MYDDGDDDDYDDDDDNFDEAKHILFWKISFFYKFFKLVVLNALVEIST